MSAAGVPELGTRLTARDRLVAFGVRLNIGRFRRVVTPGLYRIGDPGDVSPVLVTANYQPSVAAVRTSVAGLDVWVLVLDTAGINVWCAAGKGTFGTVELARRVRESGLANVVSHRTLIVPQLGAPGVAAHDVKAFTGFRVVWGPVRAKDIPAFLVDGMHASPGMRSVTFTFAERLAVTGVELSQGWRPRYVLPLVALAVAGGLGVWGYSPDAALVRGGVLVAAAYGGLLAGGLAVPLLLPALPLRAFAAKGALLGLPAAALVYLAFSSGAGVLASGAAALGCVALSSAVAMNFTGATPVTSPSGVLLEMRRAMPWQVGALALAVLGWAAAALQAGVW